jgi:squalene synthase HpnC
VARDHYENFPVASFLVPRAMRPHISAIYAFARTADDFADEGADPEPLRLQRIDQWREWLRAAADGRQVDARDPNAQAVFAALGDTIRRCDLDVRLLEDLLSAFAQDVVVKRYETWENLFDYCRRSANPVGRLVLAVAGVRDSRADTASDALCTALQLTNFWQDVAVDWDKGRLYVPGTVARAAGAREQDLERREMTAPWRNALRDAAGRTRECFDAGRAVADTVTGRLRWELRATWLGGVRVLEQLDRADYDVFHRRPSLGWRDASSIAWRAIAWRSR